MGFKLRKVGKREGSGSVPKAGKVEKGRGGNHMCHNKQGDIYPTPLNRALLALRGTIICPAGLTCV